MSWSDPDLSTYKGIGRIGRVVATEGLVIRAELPEAYLGEVCRIRVGDRLVEAEVVGFDRHGAKLMALEHYQRLQSRSDVLPSGSYPTVPAGAGTVGRVLDALGRPIDGKDGLVDCIETPLHAEPPEAMDRLPIDSTLSTGVRAIDGILTLGRGQRVGIFAAAGGGKSTLLGMIARYVKADRVVLALIGERGREVRGFVEKDLGEEGMKNSTVVVSTSDQPALMRLRAAHTATAIAEAARAENKNVVLMMDSVTRYARALREVALSSGELPARQGYPASVFQELPRLFERAGNDDRGSITAIYTVLVAGDDMNEPVADESKSLLDGHIVLSSDIAQRGRYPAIDVRKSKSRLRNDLIDEEHKRAADYVVAAASTYEENINLINMGLFSPDDPVSRRHKDFYPIAERDFLGQESHQPQDLESTRAQLLDLVGRI